MMTSHRAGFTLIEAMVAMVVATVVVLALEGSLAFTLRSLARSDREGRTARLSELQRERAFAVCAAGAGVDSANGVQARWSASLAGSHITVSQTTDYLAGGSRTLDAYDAVALCR